MRFYMDSFEVDHIISITHPKVDLEKTPPPKSVDW